MCSENSFDELLNLVEMNHQLACDPDVGGCGKLNYIHHILSTQPHVFTAGDFFLATKIFCTLLITVAFMWTLKIMHMFMLQFWDGKIHVKVLRI